MQCYKCLKAIEKEDEIHHGLHFHCFLDWFNIPSIEDFRELIIREGSSDSSNKKAKIDKINSSFFQGRFKKYSARLFDKHYLLKIKEPDYPELPLVEFLSNQIALSLKLPVAPFYLIRFQNNMDSFVTKNFVSDREGVNLIHIYRYIQENEDFNCEVLLKIVEQNTKKISASIQFIHMCLFDALIGNHDRHGRNIALIQSAQGLELAPMYDNPSYFGIEDDYLLTAEHSPRGRITTLHTNNPTMSDYIIEFKRLGYFTVIKEFHQRLIASNVIEIIESSLLSEKRKMAFKKLVLIRAKELEDGIL